MPHPNPTHTSARYNHRVAPTHYNPQKHHRHSIRLPGYDYSRAGAYFVTFVTWQRENLLGHVDQGAVHLTPAGRIVQRGWLDLPRHYPHVALDEFCIMPNHVHAIIVLSDGDCAGDADARRHALPEIVRALKSWSARRINAIRHTTGLPVWQRNYYEHILRDQDEMDRARRYIQENPIHWDADQENQPAHTS
jgi:putative transposase